MNSGRKEIDQVLGQLKEPHYIAQYLTSFGYDSAKLFLCPNPDHSEKTPSAGLIRQGPLGYCHGCKTCFDILNLCSWLEGRPANGPGWVTETVKYLADRFGIAFETPDLTAEELREMELISANSHAYQIIRHFKPAELSLVVQAALVEKKWDAQLRYKLGIGSVLSFDDYIHRMTTQYNHSLDFLKSCDLDDRRIFNSNNLIYTIKDVDGVPVGFSSRDLLFNQHQEEAAAGKIKWQPKKYVHTGETGTAFVKKSLLYNLDQAKKFLGPITVVEGASDCVSLYAGGDLGTVCTLGTAFTREHMEILIALGKRHIIVAMDNDGAGKKGVEKVIKLVDEIGSSVGTRLEAVAMPEGIKDPDEYIHKFATLEKGVEAFRKLERLDVFTWSLKKRVEAGEDPITVCQDTLPLILNEPSNILRMMKARQLARLTNTNEDFVMRELLRLMDQDDARLEEERVLVGDALAKKIRQDPGSLEAHLSAAVAQMETLNHRKVGYNHESIMKAFDIMFDEKEKNDTKFELCCGFMRFDQVFGGLPRHGSFIMLPGKPSHGKSVFLDNLIIGLLDNNPDLMIFLHTVDDSTNDRVNRILGAKTGMSSDCFRRPGYYLNDYEGQQEAPENFHERYFTAKAWLRTLHEEERLIVADPSNVPSDLRCLQAVIKDLRKKYPERTLVVFGDNFHLYSIVTSATGESYVREMSKFISEEIVKVLHTTALFTVEIPKERLRPGVRPSYLDLKGSAGLSFDAKACAGVYNQLQDHVSEPGVVSLWWESSEFMESRANPDGIRSMVKIRKPIVEVIVDKNKISGKTTTIFYRLENLSGQMTECSEREQQECRDKLAAAAAEESKQKTEYQQSRAAYRSKLPR